MIKDSLGDRMKRYEAVSRASLPIKTPIIIRVDGRAFHTYTKGLAKPFSEDLRLAMNEVAIALCKEISTAKCAYVQSDEISILLVDWLNHTTQQWFDSDLLKMCSISAGIASAKMTEQSQYMFKSTTKLACFDARAFAIPERDVNNYFLWRQKDWQRNSVQMLARSLYSNKELQGKNIEKMKEMILEKGQNWDNATSHNRDGRFISKKTFSDPQFGNRNRWSVWEETPKFNEFDVLANVTERSYETDPQRSSDI